jgi:hypothetical protein
VSGFFYYLPDCLRNLVADGTVSRDRLRRHKLDDVLADVVTVPNDVIATPTTQGPDGTAGTVLVPLSPGVPVPKVPAYDPESQTWHNAGDYWLGFEGEPPKPEHFARSSVVPGYMVPDGHGRHWHVPLVRGLDRPYGALPCDFEFGADFLPAAVLRDRYRQLWADSARMWDAYGDGEGVPDAEAASFAARALAINYRIGPHELNLLSKHGSPVLGRENVFSFAGGAIDAPAVVQFMREKKTTPFLPVPGGTASAPGTQAATSTGDQPAENSA